MEGKEAPHRVDIIQGHRRPRDRAVFPGTWIFILNLLLHLKNRLFLRNQKFRGPSAGAKRWPDLLSAAWTQRHCPSMETLCTTAVPGGRAFGSPAWQVASVYLEVGVDSGSHGSQVGQRILPVVLTPASLPVAVFVGHEAEKPESCSKLTLSCLITCSLMRNSASK
jgi:hypothetical protein